MLKKRIFLRTGTLLLSLIGCIAVTLIIFAVRDHRTKTKQLYYTVTSALAWEIERLILWDDRIAIMQAVDRAMEAHHLIEYALLVRNKKVYMNTFNGTVPTGLLHTPRTNGEASFVWEFLDPDGAVYYDMVVPVGKTGAVLRIGMKRHNIDKHTYPEVLIIALVSFIAFLVGLLLSYRIALSATREITLLSEAIHTYSDRGDDTLLKAVGNAGDVIELAQSFRDLVSVRKQSEEAMRESEKKYRRLTENSKAMIYRQSLPDGKYEYVNSASVKIIGYTPEEICKDTICIRQTIHPHWADYLEEQWQNLLKGEIPLFYEFQIIHKSGDIKWLRQQNVLIYDDGGSLIATEGIVTDETKQKHAEKSLRESEIRFRTLFSKSRDTILLLIDGVFVDCNEACLESLRTTRDQVIGKPPSFFSSDYQPDGRLSVKAGQEKIREVREAGSVKFEWVLRRMDGTEFWAEVVLTFVKIDDWNGIFGVWRDITDHKQAEEALRKSEEKLRIRNQVAAIFLTKTDNKMYKEVLDLVLGKLKSRFGIFGYINEAGALVCPSMTKDISDQCQMTDKDIIFPKDTWGDNIWGNGLKTKISAYSNKSFTVPEGHLPVNRCLSMPLVFKNKSIGLLIVANKETDYVESDRKTLEGIAEYIAPILHEILGRKSAEEELRASKIQLQQAQKMESIGTLAGGIAHDFNNILFPIFGYLEMMLEDVPTDSPLSDHLEEVFNGAKRARDLIKQILTFSRQAEHEKKPLKVQLVMEEVLKLIRSSLPTTINISQDIDDKCGLVMAASTQIHQVAMNLMTNAYHAMEETGGELTVTLKEIELMFDDLKNQVMIPGPHVCLTVADTGVGMDQSIMDRIFDPYFTTKKEGKGTGLGLAIIHGIVKTHSGHISVYSEPGMGSEFKIYLPVIKPQETAKSIGADLPIQKGNERILLVDDQEAIVDIERQMLERLGYHVTARTSSTDTLGVFRTQPDKFDVVITDMTMPNMTGDILAGEVIKIRSDIPVIICTGFSERMSKEKAAALGIKGFLMKPVLMKELSSVIRKVLTE